MNNTKCVDCADVHSLAEERNSDIVCVCKCHQKSLSTISEIVEEAVKEIENSVWFKEAIGNDTLTRLRYGGDEGGMAFKGETATPNMTRIITSVLTSQIQTLIEKGEKLKRETDWNKLETGDYETSPKIDEARKNQLYNMGVTDLQNILKSIV